MIGFDLMTAILNSFKNPVVFADTQHTIRYMNKAAIERYKDRGGADLIGSSLLECHNAESQQMIIEILAAMHNGEEERLITDNEKHRAYMRAVLGSDGELLGYYERYEPPVK